jgi:hypothetical protein
MKLTHSSKRLALLATAIALPLSLGAQSVLDRLPDETGYETGFERAGGQSVQPFFEGWQKLADGHIVMWFGYLNLNYEEQPDVPIGPNNKFDLREDLGQPTHFYPRRHLFVFKVDVPNGWDKQKRLVWTVTANGKTASANGWLQPEWEVDEGVIQMNIGPGGAPPVDPPNNAPSVDVSQERTAAVGKPLALTASATDDGIPKPRRGAAAGRGRGPAPVIPPNAVLHPRATLGLRIRWELYRSPVPGAKVTFAPESNDPVVGGTSSQLTTAATFSQPGVYWLRAVATDGMLESPYDLKVTVVDH